MTDFAEAFKLGQRNAKDAEVAKAEISDVIRTLSGQLSSATDGKLTIYIAEESSWAAAIWNTAQFANRLSGKTDPAPVKEQAICARNLKAEDRSGKRLARWVVPHEGYPCVLGFSGQEVRCHDRSALEGAFAGMLQDAWIGEQLAELIGRPEAQSVSEGKEDSEPA